MARDNIGRQVGAHTVGTGRKTVTPAGTAVALSATSLIVDYLHILAEADNTGVIVYGGSGVVAALATRQGIIVDLSRETLLTGVDLASVFIDSTVDTDGVTFAYEY